MAFCTLQIKIISTYSPTHIRKQYSKHTAKKLKVLTILIMTSFAISSHLLGKIIKNKKVTISCLFPTAKQTRRQKKNYFIEETITGDGYSCVRSFSLFKCQKLPSFLTQNHMQIHWVAAGLHKFRIFCIFFLYGKFSVSVIYLIHPATGWSGSLDVSSTCAYTSDTCLFYKSVPPWNVHHAAWNTVTGQCKPRERALQESLRFPDTQQSFN